VLVIGQLSVHMLFFCPTNIVRHNARVPNVARGGLDLNGAAPCRWAAHGANALTGIRRHLTIPIRRMLFQAVRNEQRGQVVGSLIPKHEDPKFESRHETAKKPKKTGKCPTKPL
jgi:hypothetical protein